MTIKETDIQIAICGSAGDGTIAAGSILKHAMANAGYRVIAFDTYPAEIRGFASRERRYGSVRAPADRFAVDEAVHIERRLAAEGYESDSRAVVVLIALGDAPRSRVVFLVCTCPDVPVAAGDLTVAAEYRLLKRPRSANRQSDRG